MKKIACYICSFTLSFYSCVQETPSAQMTVSNQIEGKKIASLETFKINAYTGAIAKHGNILAINQHDRAAGLTFWDLNRQKENSCSLSSPETSGFQITNLSADRNGLFSVTDLHAKCIYEVLPQAQMSKSSTWVTSTSSTPVAIGVAKEGVSIISAQKDHFIVSTGLYAKGRYRLYNSDSREENFFLTYPLHPDYPEISEYTKSILYASSILHFHPEEHLFACADMNSGLLDICLIKQNRIELVCRHQFYFPKVHITGNNVAYLKDYGYGFSSMSVSKRYIYVLHGGPAPESKIMNNTLLVFDWDGKLCRQSQVKQTLKAITFDKTNDTLYGLSDDAELLELLKEDQL